MKEEEHMNFNNPKTKRMIAGIIAGLLVLTMIVPLVASAL
jgi:hypothetical protein